ncbi:hypothetical protein DFH07DRAFT_1065677 [Mycena maculata]|uniref:Uncharacterized protein n=1 Tax=Mycena maculata TaxID=230809 RepID=A0AAD7HZX4_9AGAR|nr:hypothetical protein DFH07DRAFT_1065677 [Mycena maculata]
MDCQFVFGPNRSYFCGAGPVFAWSENNLPAGLTRVLQAPQHPQALDTPYDVAVPMEPGTFALCWKTIGGEDWYEDGCLGPHYARLARFIKVVATTGAHTTRTVFGPGASYFSMSPSGYSWQNIPSTLEEDIHNCMKIRRPTSVALGVQGSYVVLYNDGTVTFDLRGNYPLVEAMIRNTQEASRRRGVMYVALNPFIPGEFYAVYGDGSASWNFPTAWTADVTVVSREIKPVPVPSPVAAAAPGGTMVALVAQPVPVAPGGTAPAPEVISPTSSGGTASGIATSVGHAIHQEVAPQVTGGAVSSITSSVGHAVGPQITGGTVSSIASSVGHAVGPQITGGTASSIASSVGHAVAPQITDGTISSIASSVGHAIAPQLTGTVSSITSSIGHAVQAVAAEVAPAPPPAYTAQTHVSPVTPTSPPQQSPPPAAATPPAAHTINWQEGLSMGLKAAEGINKIIHVFEDQNQQGSNQPAQQGQQQDQNVFNLSNMQTSLFDQVFAQQVVYDNGNVNTTWQVNQ